MRVAAPGAVRAAHRQAKRRGVGARRLGRGDLCFSGRVRAEPRADVEPRRPGERPAAERVDPAVRRARLRAPGPRRGVVGFGETRLAAAQVRASPAAATGRRRVGSDARRRNVRVCFRASRFTGHLA